MLKIEILAPAGSKEALTAALNTGADAVYLGLDEFSARKNAANFTPTELQEAVKLCRGYGVKVFAALNTLIFEDEAEKLREYVKISRKTGVDGVIVQDLAAAEIAKKEGLPLHASTQMTIMSVSGLKALKELGFSRAVLARELSFEEISEITRYGKNIGIETEVFVHGALCASVSGQCYMSAFFGGRSGNRGTCAQPCRLNFKTEGSKTKGSDYALSLKDLSIIEHIKKLEKARVASVKIEGRMKRPEYVGAAVSACYKARETGKLDENDREILKSVFSRSGFTDGYFTGKRENMGGVRSGEDNSALLSELREKYSKPVKRFKLDIEVIIRAGNDIVCNFSAGEKKGRMTFPRAEKAENRPTKAEDVIKNLSKLGGTVYEIGEIQCEIDGGIYLSAARVNEIRRGILSKI